MSITSPDDRISTYNPVVATTEFAAGFPIFDNDDLAVYHDGVERTDFTVSATYIAGVANDARAVFGVGITGKVQVVGARDPRRTNQFNPGAPLPTRDLNLAINTTTAEGQEARRDIDRSFKAPYGVAPPAVPEPGAEKVIGWDANGNLVNIDPAEFVNDAGFATAAQGAKADTALQPGAADSNTNFLQAGTGATSRTSRNKKRDVINVLDFGAVADGNSHPLSERFATLAAAQVVYPHATSLTQELDWAAAQAAINYLKSLGGNTRPTLVFGSEGGVSRQFKIATTLNFTQMRDVGLIVDLNGSVLIGVTNGQPIIDALDSEHIEFRDGTIFGQNTQKANYGIQLGRGISGRGAAYMALRRINFTGSFTGACLLNSASEISRFEKCNFWNDDATVNNASVIQDGRRAVHVTSQFFTVTQPDDTISSHNDNLFTNCTFEKIDGVGDGYALKLYGTSRAHHFVNCYAQNQLGAAVYSSGDHVALVLDLHCEAATIENNIVIDAPNGSTTLLRNCSIKEYYMFCTDALIKGIGGTGNIFFSNSEISVQDAALNKKLFNKNGTTVRYHGDIYLGNSPSAALYDLSTLDALNGDVFGSLAASNIVPPSVGAWRFSDFNSIEQRQYGVQHVMGSLNLEPSGTNLTVSGGVLTIPRGSGSSFYVASGGNITSIAIDATADKGRLVQLFFGYSGTLTNSLAGAKTLLAGNYSFVANNSILLYSDGVKWSEISRCLNVAA